MSGWILAVVVAMAVGDEPNWSVLPAKDKWSAVQMWAVVYQAGTAESVTCAKFSREVSAKAAASEMNKMGLHPKWHLGRSYKENVAIEERILKAAWDAVDRDAKP
jgi:hypothetical protein